MNDLDALISKLSGEPTSARSPVRLRLFIMEWFVASALYTILVLCLLFHPRPDLANKLLEPAFLLEIAALFILVVSSSANAILLSYPDIHQRRFGYVSLMAFLLFASALAWEGSATPLAEPSPAHPMECWTAITLLSLPPALWFFVRIRRMASVHPTLAGGFSLLAAFSLGALVLRLSEPIDSVRHLVFWHYVPIAGVTGIGLWLGHKAFKW